MKPIFGHPHKSGLCFREEEHSKNSISTNRSCSWSASLKTRPLSFRCPGMDWKCPSSKVAAGNSKGMTTEGAWRISCWQGRKQNLFCFELRGAIVCCTCWRWKWGYSCFKPSLYLSDTGCSGHQCGPRTTQSIYGCLWAAALPRISAMLCAVACPTQLQQALSTPTLSPSMPSLPRVEKHPVQDLYNIIPRCLHWGNC